MEVVIEDSNSRLMGRGPRAPSSEGEDQMKLSARRLRLLPTIAVVSMLLAPLGAQPTQAAPTFVTHKLIGNLTNNVGFTFTPNGDVFYGDRDTGDIRIWHASDKSRTDFFTVPNVVSNGEQGLLGIALHPDFPSTPYVYVYATRNIGGTEHNQILRISDNAGTVQDQTTISSASTTAGVY